MARRLIVEITETAALEDIEETQRFIQAVRDVGARVALDDFGAGYTSFRQLKNSTVDSVKIDGSFIRNLPNHADNQLFVRNLVSIAEAFSLEAVAECVETPEEAAMLMDLGVPLMQGWHFGRPSLERPWRTANRGSTFTKQILADLSWNRPANDKPATPPARPTGAARRAEVSRPASCRKKGWPFWGVVTLGALVRRHVRFSAARRYQVAGLAISVRVTGFANCDRGSIRACICLTKEAAVLSFGATFQFAGQTTQTGRFKFEATIAIGTIRRCRWK